MVTEFLESKLDEKNAVYVEDVPAGEGWLHLIKKGQTFRILDLEGNQAVDTLFINANNPEERYSVQQTVQRQANCLVGDVLKRSISFSKNKPTRSVDITLKYK